MTARKPTLDASSFLPAEATIPALRDAVQGCRGCELYKAATQGVFGEGPSKAKLVFVGEQPGDAEDRAGRPFVGPAGQVFDRALLRAGIDRAKVYVTNAVKHFSFEQRGKARLHKRPRPGEVRACSPWLREEVRLIEPEVVVLMGATAAQAVFGSAFRVTEQRGKPLESDLAALVFATIHPSAVLRAPDHEAREAAFEQLVADFGLIRATQRGPR
jgi:uracil-DNA glycosylase family protein